MLETIAIVALVVLSCTITGFLVAVIFDTEHEPQHWSDNLTAREIAAVINYESAIHNH